MQDKLNILWSECQQILRDNLSQSAYQTWFASVDAIQWENNLLVLQVRSQFIVDYIEDNYLDILSRVLRKVFGPTVRLEYRVMMAGSSVDIPSDNLKLQTSSPVAPMVQGFAPIKSDWDSHLNTQYTFANFVKGEPNKLARAAAIEIAKNPGKTIFNPLFLFGGSGVGKTHLANAIGNEVCALNPTARVLYVAANAGAFYHECKAIQSRPLETGRQAESGAEENPYLEGNSRTASFAQNPRTHRMF